MGGRRRAQVPRWWRLGRDAFRLVGRKRVDGFGTDPRTAPGPSPHSFPLPPTRASAGRASVPSFMLIGLHCGGMG
jgi:hypothetical protein